VSSFSIPGAIEAESLAESAKATKGGAWAQDMGQWEYGEAWSGSGALFWDGGEAGSRLTIALPSKSAGRFALAARMVSGPGFGTVQFSVGGAPLGSPVDCYASEPAPRQVALGTAELKAGDNELTVALTGRDPKSSGTRVGIDAFTLSSGQ
jgi:hypothetical protein